jgi:hypothetical protein
VPPPGATSTFTFTPSPTFTFTPIVVIPTFTFTLTPSPTFTFTPIPPPVDHACGGAEASAGPLTENGNSLTVDLTNVSPETLTVDGLHIVWNPSAAVKILDQILDIDQIGNANELNSPSDFPNPNPFTGPIARRQIELAGDNMETLTINFQSPPGSGNTVKIHFTIGCTIEVSN